MWNRILNAVFPNHPAARPSLAEGREFYVFRVHLAEGLKDIVSLTPAHTAFDSGFAADTVIGACSELLKDGGTVTVANFQPNRHFVELLHGVIAAYGPKLPALCAEARRQRTGWVYVIDGRSPTPEAEVPPRDILGVFEVKDGTIVANSYQANANHQILSADGLFSLEPELHEQLMKRIAPDKRR